MNRKREQAELIYRLGRVLGPLEEAASDPARFDRDEQERIRARFFVDWQNFLDQALAFCNGEAGHAYKRQSAGFVEWYDRLQHRVTHCEAIENLTESLQQAREFVIEQVLSIPVPVDSVIHDAHTPFSTYCFVKDLCSTVRQQLVWLDRYFDQTIFHRFFGDTPAAAQVTLVTVPRAGLTNARDTARSAEFMDVSRLFAAERGVGGYRLIENAHFHDRWLRCDDRLFTLGGSIKDFDRGPFTITRLDGTPENRRHFDEAVAQGTEVFGPTAPNHP
jgi:hypothetical protein